MISSAVFARYARALVDVVMQEGSERRVSEDLVRYREIFTAVPELLELFHSPAIARDAKERVLEQLLQRYPVGPTTGNFLRVLLKQNRIRYFHEMLELYTKAVHARKGIVAARVSTAAPLSDTDLASLRAGLTRVTGRDVNLEVRTEPDLIGGVVVQIGSTVYDGSVRKQLSEMRRRLAQA